MEIRFLKWMMVVMTASLLSMSLLSCGDDGNDEVFVTAEMSDQSDFAAAGGTRKINVKSNTEWTVAVLVVDGESGWLTTDVTTGKGEQNIFVTASLNTNKSARKAIVKISCSTDGSKYYEMTFTQAAQEPTLTISATSVGLSALDRIPASVIIQTNIAWTVSYSEEWLYVDKTSGQGTMGITFSAEDNTTDSDRTATVTVTANEHPNLSQTIIVKQKCTANMLYREPFTTWKSSASEVKAYMKDYSLYTETNTQLNYEGKYKEGITAYVFESGMLKMSVVGIQSTVVSSSDIEQSLKDNNYKANETERGGRKKFVSNDYSTIVLIDLDTENNVYFIRYYDPDTYYKLFEEPYTSWGNARSTVKTLMKNRGYVLTAESTKASDDYYLIYDGKNWEAGSVYYFDGAMCLQTSAIVLDETTINQGAVEAYLKSNLKYTYYTTVGEYTYYKTYSEKIWVGVYSKNSYVYVVYFNPDNASGSRAQGNLFSESSSASNLSSHVELMKQITERWEKNNSRSRMRLITPIITR